MLVVRAGPDYDHLQMVNVNDDYYPMLINSPHFTGRLVVRVRDYKGPAPEGRKPVHNTEYFHGRRRKFSIQMEGRFKQAVTADDVYFGVDFDELLPIPSVFNVGMAAARVIDPAITVETSEERPYIMSPLVCSLNSFSIKQAPDAGQATVDPDVPLPLGDYVLGGSRALEEDTRLQISSPKSNTSMSYKDRRKYFLDKTARQQFIFTPDYVYGMDFYFPHMDFNTFRLKLGVHINVKKYLGTVPIRYVCRQMGTDVVYFVVQFEQHDE